MKQRLWLSLATYLAYCIDKELYQAIDYLREQVRVLVEHQEKQDKRIRLTNSQRMRVTTSRKGWMRHLTGLERNLDTMLSEEENNRFQHVLAMVICNRCLDLLILDFSEKTKVFLRRIKYPDERKCSII